MRGPVYKTVKMGKLHWRIKKSDFFGGTEGEQTGGLLEHQFSEKQQIALDEVWRLAIKAAPDQYFTLLSQARRQI